MAAAIPLVFGAAGAWLAPAGYAALGYTIGATIGSMLFAPKQQDQHFYGARLQDLRATQVEYGSPIHIRLGQTRGAGTVIWQSDFREVATTTTQRSGGKGGGGGATSSQTTYSYFVDLMLLVNDIPSVGLLRVWKNNELVYNLSPTATGADIAATTSTEHWAAIRFYGGAAAQLPDPDYEAAKGVGNVPAHRGSTTIFIKNLALGGGDMLPSLEFEIFTTDGDYIIRLLDADTLASPDVGSSDLLNDAIADAFTGTWPVIVTQWTATGSRPYSFNTTTHIYPMTVDDAGNLVAAGATSYGNPITNPPANASLADSSLVTLATPDNLTYPIALAFDWRNGELGAVSANITAFKARQTAEWNGLLTSQAAALATIDAIPELVSSGQVGGDYANLFEAEDARDTLIAANPVEDTTLGEVISGTAALAIAEVITNAGETGCSIEWTGTFTGKKRIVKRVTKSYVVEPNGTELLDYTQPLYMYKTGSIEYPSIVEVLFFIKIYAAVGEHVNSTEHFNRCTDRILALGSTLFPASVGDLSREYVTDTGWGYARIRYSRIDGESGIYYYVDYAMHFNANTGGSSQGTEVANLYKVTETVTTTIVIEDLPAATASFTASAEQAALVGGFAVDYTAPIGGYDFSVGQPYTITTNLFNGAVPTSIEPLSLQSAVAQLCNFSGLDAGDIDVSALSAITTPVVGLTITTASNMRQPIEALMGSYYFTACQSGNKIKFTPRGGSSLAAFAYDDLGASFGDSTESALSFNMTSDTELPSRMSVTYQVLEGDYQKDTQMSDRIVTAETNTVSDVMLPIIMSAEQAKGVAITNALDAQTSLMSAKIKVLFDHPELEPGDVVTVTDRDGSQYRMRITQITDSFPIREFDLVLDDPGILTYSGITNADFFSQSVVLPLVDSDGLYLDIPILSDINNDAGFYVVSGPVAEGKWYGAVTLQSDNDLDYVSGVDVPERGYFGACSTTLGDWTGYHVFDEQNSVTFTLPTDAVLTSSTRAGVLASQTTNAFLIGNEIVQAVDCTEISAGVWKLTRLLRGLRGTEWAMVDHGAGERAVWLRADGMRRLPMSNSLLGLSRYYKTFSVGRNAADYAGEAFVNMAIGLKPFSPTTARGERDLSGNLTITWQRRTRLSCRYGGAMGVSIPLGENVEQYEIDIYDDNTYTTVLRTIAATSESAEYTAAQQATDFGSAQAQVYVKIYQVSQVVDRGYALTGAV